MYKSEYLSRLRAALVGVDKKEAEGLIEYYDDLIADGLENGGGEAFIDNLEPPELVAQNFMREVKASDSGHSTTDDDNTACKETESPYERETPEEKSADTPKAEQPPDHDKNPSGAVKIILSIACIAVAFVGAIFLFSISIAAFSIVVSGIFSFISAFALLGTHTATAFAQLGFGIACTAIGILVLIFIPFIAGIYANVVRRLCRKEPKPKNKFKWKKLCGTAVVGFVAGVAVFVCAFGAIGFDGNRLAGYDNMVVRVAEAEIPADAFSLVSDNLDLDVKYSDDGAIRLEYMDFDDEPKNYSYENGTMQLKSHSLFGNLSLIWKHGVFFSVGSNDYYKATLYLPKEIGFDVGLELSNGKIDIRSMDFVGLTLSTDNGAVFLKNFRAQNLSVSTDNGAVMLENADVQETVSVTATNGAVSMKNVEAAAITGETTNGAARLEKCKAAKILAKTSNGAVNVESVVGDEIELITHNGSVRGTIAGKKGDYKIVSETSNGSNNLSNKDDGSKLLKVSTKNGAINVTFVE